MSAARDRTILVVDDDLQLALGLQKRLIAAGYDAETATCGTEAFRRIRAGGIDAITLDVGLPDQVDGLDVAAVLRRDADTAGVPIIFITGRTDHAVRSRYRTAGGRYLLAKPYDAAVLLRMLDGIFAEREQRDAERRAAAMQRSTMR